MSEFDLLIAGGSVLDGSGSSAVSADVAISQGRIVQVAKQGELKPHQAKRVLDAEGQVVAPGFIDMHSHDDFNLPLNPLAPGKTRQGVTTQVTGNCGWSPAPLLPEHRQTFIETASFLDSGLDYDWDDMGAFLARMPPLAQNIVQLVGHVTLRCAVMGIADRAPTPDELESMRGLVAQSMEQGAYGFSTGLIYPPSAFADTEELVELAKVAARYGGSYHTHMRDEGKHIFDSVREAAEIGRRAGIPVQISHLKLSGKTYWGQANELLRLIEDLRDQGVALHCDQYPYPAGSSGLKSLLPNWAHEGGTQALMERLKHPETRDRIRAEMLEGMSEHGYMNVAQWTDVMIAESQSQPRYNGLDLGAIGGKEDKLPVDALLDLLLADYAKTLAIFFSIGVEDMLTIMRHPQVSIGSDGINTAVPGQPDATNPHPRYYGTFPRVLGRYARDEQAFSLAEAVRKMTSLPADALGLTDRGRLKPGCAADVVIFDPEGVVDVATYTNPKQYPLGINTVLVNGVPIVEKGQEGIQETGATPGVILKRQ